MKIMGNLVVVVPVDPTLLERGAGTVKQNFEINDKTETWDLRWRIVSVGDGSRYATDGGQVVHFPLQVRVGDIVVLRTSDVSCGETWDREKFYWHGVRDASDRRTQSLGTALRRHFSLGLARRR